MNYNEWEDDKIKRDKYMDDNTGKCFTCSLKDYIHKFIPVKDYNQIIQFYLCHMCHQALWHYHRGDEMAIFLELHNHQKKMRLMDDEVNKVKKKEKYDDVRLNKAPITLVDVAEFCWKMNYEKYWFNKL